MKDRFKELRKALDLNQQEFADHLNLSRSFITHVETGQRIPSDRTIQDICRIFNVDEAWLRTGEGDMFTPENDEEDVIQFCANILKEDKSSTKYRIIRAIAKLDIQEWEIIEKFMDEILDSHNGNK